MPAPSCSLFDLSDDKPQLDGPPASATDAELEAWWTQMQGCREAQLALQLHGRGVQ